METLFCEGYRLRKSTMHGMELKVLCRMIILLRSALFKTICHSSNASSGTTHPATLDILCGPIETICHRSSASTRGMDPAILGMHRWPLLLSDMAIPIINHRGSSQHSRSSS